MKQIEHDPNERPRNRLFDLIGYLIAWAILMPIAMWIERMDIIANWIRATFY